MLQDCSISYDRLFKPISLSIAKAPGKQPCRVLPLHPRGVPSERVPNHTVHIVPLLLEASKAGLTCSPQAVTRTTIVRRAMRRAWPSEGKCADPMRLLENHLHDGRRLCLPRWTMHRFHSLCTWNKDICSAVACASPVDMKCLPRNRSPIVLAY